MVKPEHDGSVNYYECLQVLPTASADDIRQQYRKLALLYHPDRNLGNEAEFKRKFQSLNMAYEVLSDAEKKKSYDRARLIVLSSKVTPNRRESSCGMKSPFRSSFTPSFVPKTPTHNRSPGSPHSSKSSPSSKSKYTSQSKRSEDIYAGYENWFSKSTSAYSFFYERNSPKFNPRKPSYTSPYSSPISKKQDEEKGFTKVNDDARKAAASKYAEARMQSEKENLKDIFKKNMQTSDEKASTKHTFFDIKSKAEHNDGVRLQSRGDNTLNHQNIFAKEKIPLEKASELFSFSFNKKKESENIRPVEQPIVFEKFSNTKLNESSFSFSSIPTDLKFGTQTTYVNENFQSNDGKETRFNSLKGTLKQNKKRNTIRSLRHLSSQMETGFNPVFSTKIPDNWCSDKETFKKNDSTKENREDLDLKKKNSNLSDNNLGKNPLSSSSRISFTIKKPSSLKTENPFAFDSSSKEIKKNVLLDDISETSKNIAGTFEDRYNEKYGKTTENKFKHISQKSVEINSSDSDLLSERVKKELESYRNFKISYEAEKANKNINKSSINESHVSEQFQGLTLSASKSSENNQKYASVETSKSSSFIEFSRFQVKTEKHVQNLQNTNDDLNIPTNMKKKGKFLNIPEFPDPVIPLLSPSIPNCLTASSFSIYLKEMIKYQQIWLACSSTYLNFFQKWEKYKESCHRYDLLKDTDIYEAFIMATEKEEKIREGWWSEEKRYRQALKDFLHIKKTYEYGQKFPFGPI
ncbi:hypothetical protein T552_01542 [Pneumocystis carinii B80]|uniref:J domain-containing protein n=1 Tax=Pneumocystis carinii (strain B80) TaxID=1408658 RepID=A0A0W4ZKL3_PNEC8|nr:hypothetical protein T552_01542 [Pneumocystis carinii B80]KTW28915.1 hypothetical protein T552_01542 [Pneumocystis carinii B80]